MEQVIALIKTFDEQDEVLVSLKTFAEAELIKLNEAAQKRHEKTEAKKAELKPLMDKIYEDILSTEAEPVTASMVGERLEISPQKATAILRKMVEAEMANSKQIKVQKRTVKGYFKK